MRWPRYANAILMGLLGPYVAFFDNKYNKITQAYWSEREQLIHTKRTCLSTAASDHKLIQLNAPLQTGSRLADIHG